MKYEINHTQAFDLITIDSTNFQITLSNYGAGIIDLKSYDRFNNLESICLGYNDLSNYIKDDYYFGKTIGRVAGRITNGRFKLGEKEYQVEINEHSSNCNLHSGSNPIAYQLFEYTVSQTPLNIQVTFNYYENTSDFPGNIEYQVIYTIHDTFFMIEHKAKSDKMTLCNMTNHAYFNLSGNFKQNLYHQQLQLDADYYLNLNNWELEPVNFVMDFRNPKLIGTDINDSSLIKTSGYDHYFKINENGIARMYDPESGRHLDISGSSSGVVCYSGGYFDGSKLNQVKEKITKHQGITFEFQNIPNGINLDTDDKSILKKNQEYYQFIIYQIYC